MFRPQVSSDAKHGFIYYNNGDLYIYGKNENPELIYVTTRCDIKKIICSAHNSFILIESGILY